ncbi:pentatricopeptide repeat-containing protein At3g49170, chloroplastic [Impatiens glandulifera]|uniref:pentatricopeptide repeat-containing protein At3g49170, chloroplastic n=1 Tax=Impatiens glandulifera TaxID=253017 RepID=UPI001FB17464|nr:pentatricopeptide repeat-containing protein At3g49170, chloroplastic [Impatiens glandulifera]
MIGHFSSALAVVNFSPSSTKLPSHVQSSRNVNFESLKDRLIGFASVGHLRRAISTLDYMTSQGLTPDVVSYSFLLKSCIRTRHFDLGKLVHHKLSESGIELDSILLNSLISLYSKSGDWKTANSIFEEMGISKRRNMVSWSSMISCFSHNGLGLRAIQTFLDMIECGEYPNHFCFAAVIHACSNPDNAWIGKVIHGFVIKTGYLDADVCVGCALIDFYVKSGGDLDSARQVFDEMPERNPVTWTLLITRFAQFGYPKDALELFIEMLVNGFVPDVFTFSGVVSACSELKLLSFGRQVHSHVIKFGLVSDICVGCSLVDMYAKCSLDLDDSRKFFERMPNHNVMSWTAFITGCVQSGKHDKEALQIYSQMMINNQSLPNHFTFSSLLKACGNLSDPISGEQIHNQVVKFGFESVNCVGNSLISMYARSNKLEDARKAFDLLFEKNLISYNAILDGYTKSMDSSEASFGLFNELENKGIEVDAYTYASLLSGAATIGAVSRGEQIHARVIKEGLGSNRIISNALISMYSKCGNIDSALNVFQGGIESPNVISWTSIITGFAKHGLAERAIDMFENMVKTGVKPNEVTYVAVLSACSHVGFVDEGWKYFNSMMEEHGIKPRMEHYACMVDLLGRSGFLDEALRFIGSMPFEADTLVWRTLLGSCRIHGNANIGKHAAEMIFERDPNDTTAYVLLSNLYASVGRWSEVIEMRKKMKERNLVKEAGCSWIERDGRIHKFFVGDTFHPRAKEIYEEIESLGFKIKEMGYVANTNLVLHEEVEEELKEEYLFQHSERIAVAFGIISSKSDSKPIRVFKNLRVCDDCHVAMKYISIAAGREIVLRDSNRFHHFRNGVCSCNEYW